MKRENGAEVVNIGWQVITEHSAGNLRLLKMTNDKWYKNLGWAINVAFKNPILFQKQQEEQKLQCCADKQLAVGMAYLKQAVVLILFL